VQDALRAIGAPGLLDAPDLENPDPTRLGLMLDPGLTFRGAFPESIILR